MLKLVARSCRPGLRACATLSRCCRPSPNATCITKLPSTSRHMSAVMHATSFDGRSEVELATWLSSLGVDIRKYGQGEAKSVADLLEEVALGESVLLSEAGRAVREVCVLNLLVTNSSGQVLHEAQQVLPDGRQRVRNLPLSEKLVAGEDWRAAVRRAVLEELGPALPSGLEPEVQLDEASYRCIQKQMESPSYPQLATRYSRHVVAAAVKGLPQGPFSTAEPRPGGQLVTHWVWR